MRDYKLIFLIVFGSLVLLGISWIEFHLPEPPVTGGSNLNVAEALGGGDVSGYTRALEPRPFAFPSDHADHPEFRNE